MYYKSLNYYISRNKFKCFLVLNYSYIFFKMMYID